MWNILIVLVIAAIIFLFNPLKPSDLKPGGSVDKKTQTQVNQVETEAVNQVNHARQIQHQQEQTIDN